MQVLILDLLVSSCRGSGFLPSYTLLSSGYRKGGPLAITDANLVLGRILPDYFPKCVLESSSEPRQSTYFIGTQNLWQI